jgi:hypothetical protein
MLGQGGTSANQRQVALQAPPNLTSCTTKLASRVNGQWSMVHGKKAITNQPVTSPPTRIKYAFVDDKTRCANHPQPLLSPERKKGRAKEGSYQHFDIKPTHNPHQISIRGRQNSLCSP